MSPRAAWRLEALGFSRVYDYLAGKKDWMASGLPVEGRKAGKKRAGDIARRNPPTCRPDEPLDQVLERMQSDLCVVVNDHNVIQGRIRRSKVSESPHGTTVEEVMELGPTTIRPDTSVERIAKRMRKANVETILVSTDSGDLLGILHLNDAEKILESRAEDAG